MKFSLLNMLPRLSLLQPALLAVLGCMLPWWAAHALAQAGEPPAPQTSGLPAPQALQAPQAEAPQTAGKSGMLNDDGGALTPPDLSLYQGQLAAIQKLQRDNLELKLQLEQAKLKEQIAVSKNNGKLALGADASPYVVNLTGVGDARQALIMVPGYGQATVRVGDTLPNQWTVIKIDDAGVVVSAGRHAKPVRLRFHADESLDARVAGRPI